MSRYQCTNPHCPNDWHTTPACPNEAKARSRMSASGQFVQVKPNVGPQTTTFAGVQGIKALPTTHHWPVMGEDLLGTVWATNPLGEVRHFDYDHDAAREWLALDDTSDPRITNPQKRRQTLVYVRKPETESDAIRMIADSGFGRIDPGTYSDIGFSAAASWAPILAKVNEDQPRDGGVRLMHGVGGTYVEHRDEADKLTFFLGRTSASGWSALDETSVRSMPDVTLVVDSIDMFDADGVKKIVSSLDAIKSAVETSPECEGVTVVRNGRTMTITSNPSGQTIGDVRQARAAYSAALTKVLSTMVAKIQAFEE